MMHCLVCVGSHWSQIMQVYSFDLIDDVMLHLFSFEQRCQVSLESNYFKEKDLVNVTDIKFNPYIKDKLPSCRRFTATLARDGF